ncbi:MAG: flagellar basal body rod protein FlgB [Planctomycetes bacterium]|nr:flagellar basal body rod protein FlgB [Planctomycetota bacterium]
MDLRVESGDLLSQLLSASVRRQEVVMGNIANVNTPGYTRRMVRFEEAVRKALESGRDPTTVAPEIELDLVTPARADGNNTSLELEMHALRENKLLYDSYAAILTAKYNLIRVSLENSR